MDGAGLGLGGVLARAVVGRRWRRARTADWDQDWDLNLNRDRGLEGLRCRREQRLGRVLWGSGVRWTGGTLVPATDEVVMSTEPKEHDSEEITSQTGTCLTGQSMRGLRGSRTFVLFVARDGATFFFFEGVLILIVILGGVGKGGLLVGSTGRACVFRRLVLAYDAGGSFRTRRHR